MIKRRTGFYFLSVATLLYWLCFAVLGCSGAQPLAALRESGVPSRETSFSPGLDTITIKPTSQLWETYIGDALPAEWIRDSQLGVITDTYQQNGWKPLWVDGLFKVSPRSEILLSRLARLQEEAIDPQPYRLQDLHNRIRRAEEIRSSLQQMDHAYRDSEADTLLMLASTESGSVPVQVGSGTGEDGSSEKDLTQLKKLKYEQLFLETSAIDVRLTRTLVRFANEMNPFSRELQIRALLDEMPLDKFLKELEPPGVQYHAMISALAKYRNLASHGSWQKVSAPATLKPGDSGPEVRQIQKRLQDEGFYSGKIHGHFDEPTREALKNFQRVHQLEPDGSVGKQTIERMNISYQEKLTFIEQGLKALRQSPTRRYDRYIRINIPQFILEYVKDGQPQSVHRVIVGKASGKKVKVNGRWVGENQTPTLSSNIEQVVINPKWIVSERIRMELSSEIAADPSYLSKHGYDFLASSPYPWGEPRLYQRPGPTNPLGRIKFEFPNAYAVFLHDTPKKHLFNRTQRDFSHGCIRVERAQELAQTLLKDDNNPAAEKIDAYLATNKETYVKLKEPVPIIIEYIPAITDQKGHLFFYSDPYNWYGTEVTTKNKPA